MSQAATERTRAAFVALLAIWVAGLGALLIFFKQMMSAGGLASLALPAVAAAAGAASTFNPCALPALPGFLTFIGSGSHESSGRRTRLSLAAGLGATLVSGGLGVVVVVVGGSVKQAVAPQFRWVQLGVGVVMVALAALHLLDRTATLPSVGRIVSAGNSVWDRAVGRPSTSRSLLFGGGYVAVGAG